MNAALLWIDRSRVLRFWRDEHWWVCGYLARQGSRREAQRRWRLAVELNRKLRKARRRAHV